MKLIYLPGHGFALHFFDSVSSPGQTENFLAKLNFSCGTSQTLFRFWFPPPQLLEHDDHSPHLVHSKYFFEEKNRINKSKINYSLKFTKKDQIPGHGCLLQVPISVGSPRLQYFGSRTLLVSMDLPKKNQNIISSEMA